ncbi:MAG: hypothetical protein JW845_06775 [Dehalococcoidales bacterium]|nr:hypothetical protein [Dehalococcoidales bacterium]
MGFLSFLKNIFAGGHSDDEALDAARARHGVHIDEKAKKDMDKPTTEAERFADNYDTWEELKNYRMTFLFGSWITRKFRPIGEDKVKKQLEDLEKKRRLEAERKKQQEKS